MEHAVQRSHQCVGAVVPMLGSLQPGCLPALSPSDGFKTECLGKKTRGRGETPRGVIPSSHLKENKTEFILELNISAYGPRTQTHVTTNNVPQCGNSFRKFP